MLDIETEFFTQFKSVDAICRDMFLGEHIYNNKGAEVFGISAYIRLMETENYSIRAVFPEWDEQYKRLKRLRWIRSQIAHNVATSECEESDLEDIHRFYQQIMTQTDILARANRIKEQRAKGKTASKPADRNYAARQLKTQISATDDQNPQNHKKKAGSHLWLWIIGIASVIIIVLMIVGKFII